MNIKPGKYRASNGLVVEVLHVGDRSVFYRTHDGYEGMVSISHAEAYWSEYKEPRTITFFFNIYEHGGVPKVGGVWETRAKAVAMKQSGVIDTMEVTWTEKTDG